MDSNETIDAYNRYAQVYDEEVVEFWDNFPRDFIDYFVRRLPGKQILDVGSGSGRDALLLRSRGLTVICVDASSSMVNMTNALGFESHCKTFNELDFPAESFDGVWAYTSLIHVPTHEAKEAIGSIYKLVKPHGLFAIGIIEGQMAEMVERETMPGVSRYFKKYRRDEITGIIEDCGFKFLFEQDYQPRNSTYLNQIYSKVV